MEPVSWLVSLLVIVGSGSLAKVGENITDATVKLAQSLLSRKAPNSQTAKLMAAGEKIDYQQAVIDVEAIADDPEVTKLLDEVRSLLASNQDLAAKVEALQSQLNQSKSGDTINNIGKQVNIEQSGTNNTQNNTFNL